MDETILQEVFDIVVIGAGPGGSAAARVAAQKGLKVLLLDQKRRIGLPVQCGELVSQWIYPYLHPGSRSIVQPIDSLILHFPDGILYPMKSPGFMLDRSIFDQEMVLKALQAGARLLLGIKAIGRTPDGIKVRWRSKEGIVRSKVVIGADGVNSTVRGWSTHPILKSLSALQYEIYLPEPQSHGEIFFHPDYEGGYAWFFPKGKVANVGIGVIHPKTSLLKDLLHSFLGQLRGLKKFKQIEILFKTGGSIPCEPHPLPAFENILLVGDAAGHCHPVTGAGILNAIQGGEIAGRIAAEAVLRQDLEYLNHYEREWEEGLGNSLLYGVAKRERLEKNWNRSGMDFQELIRNCWTGFKEYHFDRRKGLL